MTVLDRKIAADREPAPRKLRATLDHAPSLSDASSERRGSITARRAQAMLEIVSLRIAPAAAAAAVIQIHAGRLGLTALVLLGVLLASALAARIAYPLQLMPVARFTVRACVPASGLAITGLVAFAAGNPIPVLVLLSALIQAWLITALGGWVAARFRNERQIPVAVIGSPEVAAGLSAELKAAGINGYVVRGWVSIADEPRDEVEVETAAHAALPRLGPLSALRWLVQEHGIELLVHAPPAARSEARAGRLEVFEHVAAACLDLPVRMIEASQLYELLLGHVPIGQINAAWYQYVLHPRYRAGSPLSKRVLDLAVGGIAALVAAPVLAVAALAIKLGDPSSPVLYRQRRVGEGGREFEILKLRTMRPHAQANGAQWSSRADSRVTRIGRLLRRLHLDELPQLWNVLRGEMTLVGPRPEQPALVDHLERRFAHYERRVLVKPGITGWAQVRCGYAGTEEGSAFKLCHDLYYLKHRSPVADLLIMLETLGSLGHRAQYEVEAPARQFLFGEATP